jgi:hypothetical protein
VVESLVRERGIRAVAHPHTSACMWATFFSLRAQRQIRRYIAYIALRSAVVSRDVEDGPALLRILVAAQTGYVCTLLCSLASPH